MEDDKEFSDKKKSDNIVAGRFENNLGYQEHLARYSFVKEFVKDKLILDLGCGMGDGTYGLSLSAKKAVGIEVDMERLRCAFDNFSNTNLDYLRMDGCLLGFKDNTFDLVVSLEVIEHLEKQSEFLAEIKRVLKTGGIAVISTPNKDVIKIEGTPYNPTHLKELSFAEFSNILSRYFREAEFYGQSRGKGVKGAGGVVHYLVRLIDLLGVRKLFPQKFRDNIYDKIALGTGAKNDAVISIEDVIVSRNKVSSSRNIIVICKKGG